MFTFKRTALALAACAALFPAHAQSPAETTIAAGLGVFSGKGADRALFNQYRGVDKDSSVAAMLDVDYSLRQDETGDWVDFQGYDLLYDTRELDLSGKNRAIGNSPPSMAVWSETTSIRSTLVC
jgi:hypothetical protein